MTTINKNTTLVSPQPGIDQITDYDYAITSSASVPAISPSDLTIYFLAFSADSGVSKNDFITNVAQQTITAKLHDSLESSAYLWGSVDNGATWTDITGMVKNKNISWTNVTLSGSSAIVFKTTDAAGNITARSSGQAYVLDQSAAHVTPVLAHDTGDSNSDRVTTDATVRIQGLEQGAAWQYSTNNGRTWTQGSGTSIAASVFKSGTTTLLVKQTDLAGNVSETGSLSFTLDTRVATPTLALASDTGLAGDSITNKGAITVTNLEDGASWTYSLDNGSTWNNGSGTAIASSVFKRDGEYAVLVRQTDRAGNKSGTSSVSFTRDTTVAAPTVALFHDTGSSTTDKKTSDGTLRISGIDDDATWQYNIDNTGWKTGSGGFISDKLFSVGKHSVAVKQTDTTGNTSSSAFSFELESHKPQVVLYSDTGSSSSDNITKSAALYITGLNGSSLKYSVNGGKEKISSTTDGIGSAAFKEGENVITYAVKNANGKYGDWMDYTFVWDTIKPNAPSLALLSDTGSNRTDRVTNNGAVLVTGLETGATWEYSANDGSWVAGHGKSVSENAFKEGKNKLEVRQIDVAGNKSSIAEYTFTFDEKAPVAPALALQNDTGSSAKDSITRDGSVKIMGLEAGASWWYSFTNTSGSWVKGTGKVLASNLLGSDGAKTVYVRQVDSGENVSETASLSFTLDTKADKAPLVNLEHDTGTSNSDHITNNIGTINVSGIASGSTWQYNINYGAWIAGGSGRSIAGNLFHEGENTVLVRQYDAAGNESSNGLIFTLDTKCAPHLSLLHDTGNSSSDNVTSVGTVVVSGIEDVASWQYRIDQATDWVIGKGNEIPASAFTKGAHTVYVQATDKAGNMGTTSLSFTLAADSGPLIALKHDTGWSATDNITNDGTIHITFSTIDPVNHKYQFSVDGGASWYTREQTVTELTTGVQGLNTFQIRELHNDGTTGETSTFSFTLDSTPPQTPSLSLVNQTGPRDVTDYHPTYDGTVKVSGLDADTKHYWGFNGGYGHAEGPSGAVEFFGDIIPSSAFTLGVHTIYVFQEDMAGNRSNAGNLTFTLQSLSMLDEPPLSLANDTGSSDSDNITKDGTVKVMDFGDKISWEYSLDNGAHWVQGSGHSIAANAFHEGINTVTLRIKDKYTSDYITGTSEFTFTLDTQKPSSPTVSLLHDTGNSTSDNVTSDGTVVISGIDEEGATWRFKTAASPDNWIEGGKIWDNVAGVSRNAIPASYIHEGSNTIYVYTRDKAGNASDISTLTFTLDSEVPAVFLANDAGPSSRDNITNDAEVNVVCHTSSTYEWSLDGGHWTKGSSATISQGFFHEGVNTLQVRETYGNGTTGAISSLTFTLETKAPETPGISILNDKIEITGLETDTTWFYNIDRAETHQGQGNAILATDLPVGTHHFYIYQEDTAGNLSHTYHFDVSSFDFPVNHRDMEALLVNDAGSSNQDKITNDATVRIVSHDGGTHYEWSLDGIKWTERDGANPTEFTINKTYFHEGVNTLQVRELYNDGTIRSISPLTFTLETKAPDTPVINKLSEKIEVTGLEADATWFYNLDRAENHQGQGDAISANSLPVGDHHLYIYQQDLAGNVSLPYHMDITVSQFHTIL